MRRIAIIAGEPSGDLLAARLISSLQQLRPDLVFEGIAGPEMQATGCNSLFPQEALTVMGLSEVLRHLPELLSIRKKLFERWRDDPPDLFIGVDAPDFNLPLAKKLHAIGVPTAHYVSPSVWAWREKRVKKIQGNIDLMLTLFPFEVDFYQRYQVPAKYVGHPLADEIEFDASRAEARDALGLAHDKQLLAVLPGSRSGEIKRLAPCFLATAAVLQKQYPDLQVAVPVVKPAFEARLEQERLEHAPDLRVTYIAGHSRKLMQAADFILLASGTAVLEGMLCGRLMVAAYRVSGLTWWILQTFRLLKVKYVTLPNHMAGEMLVAEVLQDAVTVERLEAEIKALLTLSSERQTYINTRFCQLHRNLRCNASATAAKAILEHFDA
ncbi:MAG: lipid-A-disaccharide synthase [Thiolinea sp.]